ncbi:MAG: hypothetical protein Kapaf2KO_16990 [Candidatus Kapaibacteriales bacterium]
MADIVISVAEEQFGAGYEFAVLESIDDMNFAEDGITADIVFDQQLSESRLRYSIAYYLNKKTVRKVPVLIGITSYQYLPVLNKHIRAGEEINKSDITMERVSANSIGIKIIEDASDAIGKVALDDISKGSLLRVDNFSSGIKINRGDEIELRIVKGTVMVRAKATALEDGLPGRKIRLERQGSKRILTAVVAEDGYAIMTGN